MKNCNFDLPQSVLKNVKVCLKLRFVILRRQLRFGSDFAPSRRIRSG